MLIRKKIDDGLSRTVSGDCFAILCDMRDDGDSRLSLPGLLGNLGGFQIEPRL